MSSQPSHLDERPLINLKLWYLQLARGSRGVKVCGFRNVDDNTLQRYSSSAIVNRESYMTVSTANTRYNLLGLCDEDSSLLSDFPSELIKMFHGGFPVDWKERLEEYFDDNEEDLSQFALENEANTQSQTMITSILEKRKSLGKRASIYEKRKTIDSQQNAISEEVETKEDEEKEPEKSTPRRSLRRSINCEAKVSGLIAKSEITTQEICQESQHGNSAQKILRNSTSSREGAEESTEVKEQSTPTQTRAKSRRSVVFAADVKSPAVDKETKSSSLNLDSPSSRTRRRSILKETNEPVATVLVASSDSKPIINNDFDKEPVTKASTTEEAVSKTAKKEDAASLDSKSAVIRIEEKPTLISEKTPESMSKIAKNEKPREILFLDKWFFGFIPSYENENVQIILVGSVVRDSGEMYGWRTTEIMEVDHSTHIVKTARRQYTLGRIDESMLVEGGFPLSVINQFRDKFPSNWKDILQRVYNAIANGRPVPNIQPLHTTPERQTRQSPRILKKNQKSDSERAKEAEEEAEKAREAQKRLEEDEFESQEADRQMRMAAHKQRLRKDAKRKEREERDIRQANRELLGSDGGESSSEEDLPSRRRHEEVDQRRSEPSPREEEKRRRKEDTEIDRANRELLGFDERLKNKEDISRRREFQHEDDDDYEEFCRQQERERRERENQRNDSRQSIDNRKRDVHKSWKNGKPIKKSRLSMVAERTEGSGSGSDSEISSDSDDGKFKIPIGKPKRRSVNTNAISPSRTHLAVQPGVQVQGVHLSRSGRLVHPPLAQWAGERISYDKDGNVLSIQGMTTQSLHTLRRGVVDTAAIARHYGLPTSPVTKTKQADNLLSMPVPEPKIIRRVSVGNKKRCYSSSEDDEYMEEMRNRCGTPGQPLKKRNPKLKHTVDSEDEEEEARRIRQETRDVERLKKKIQKEMRRLEEEYSRIDRRSRVIKKRPSKIKIKEEVKKRVQPKREKPEKKATVAPKRAPAKKSTSSSRGRKKKQEEPVEESESENESENSQGPSAESDSASDSEPEQEAVHVMPHKNKPIKKADIDKLKVAIGFHQVRTDEDWEVISKALGEIFDANTCKELAVSRLNWKPPVEEKENAMAGVTARLGTKSYEIQADTFTRNYVRGGGVDDFFQDKESVPESPSVDDTAAFDPDNSMLELMNTPPRAALPAPPKRKGRRDLETEEMMSMIEEQQNQTRMNRTSFTPIQHDSVEREKKHRYVSHIRHNATLNKTVNLMSFRE